MDNIKNSSYDEFLSELPKKMNMETFRNVCPTSEKELYAYIEIFFGFKIPRVSVCEGHCSPFQFIADIFFEKEMNILGFASRASGKTRSISILHILNSHFKPTCDTSTIGAIELQAQRCYQYLLEYLCQKNGMFFDTVKNSRIGDTVFTNGSRIEVLPATLRSVNSPHPQKAFLDEVELIEWDIFQEYLNMAHSSEKIKAQNILISSRKWLTGTMQKILEEEKKFKTYTWCIFEVAKKCERDCEKCKAIMKGEKRNFYDVCRGRMKKSDGFVEFNDIINRFLTLDENVWKTQQECLAPETEGLVHSWFQEQEEITRDDLSEIYECIDWGGTDPFVCLWFQKVGGEFWFLDEIYRANIAVTDFLEMIKAKRDIENYRITNTYVDPAGKDCRNEFEKGGIFTKITSHDVEYGIQIIRSLGESGKIKISPKCANLIREIREYRLDNTKEGRIKYIGRDHACDAMRYGIVGILQSKEPNIWIL